MQPRSHAQSHSKRGGAAAQHTQQGQEEHDEERGVVQRLGLGV